MAQQVTITLDLGAMRTLAAAELYKWGEANRDDANYQRIYELQFSSDDNVDSTLLALYVSQRAERIADAVSEYLTGYSKSGGSASYTLTLPAGWNSNTQASLQQLFKDYVTDGSVGDWLTHAGAEQGKVFNAKALEHAIGIQRNIYHKNPTIS